MQDQSCDPSNHGMTPLFQPAGEYIVLLYYWITTKCITSDVKRKETEKEKVLNQSYQSLCSGNKKYVVVYEQLLPAQEQSKHLMKLSSVSI